MIAPFTERPSFVLSVMVTVDIVPIGGSAGVPDSVVFLLEHPINTKVNVINVIIIIK
jgi:hypothetical protein